MSDMGKMYTFWTILVIALLLIIGALIYTSNSNRNTASDTQQQNVLNSETNTDEASIVEETKEEKWETYSNAKYGFEMSIPAGTKVEEKGELVKTIVFTNEGLNVSFVVKDDQYVHDGKNLVPISFKDYHYMDIPRNFETKLGGKTAAVFEAPRGYCDGPGCSDPYIAYAVNRDIALFHNFVFFGDVEMNATEKQILESISFMNPEITIVTKSFSNAAGGYSFKYQSPWTAAVNKYAAKYTLFGKGTSSTSGEGGVEVRSFNGTVAEYLDDMEKNADIKFLNREDVTINGLAGIRAETQAMISGHAVILKKGNQIFHIFINSRKAADVALFNALVASFKVN